MEVASGKLNGLTGQSAEPMHQKRWLIECKFEWEMAHTTLAFPLRGDVFVLPGYLMAKSES